MKILLAAINAKYIHSNPAVYSLKAFAGRAGEEYVDIAEYTINNRTEHILADIYERRPDVVAFSCYIWNIAMVEELVEGLSVLMPQAPLWAGGPEVSYEPESVCSRMPGLTGIMVGEGEKTFSELLEYYVNQSAGSLQGIRGLYLTASSGPGLYTGDRSLTEPDSIPFFYERMPEEAFAHKILYYETSRGCPFRCSYCLSSVDKTVRLRSLDRVFRELQFFLDRKAEQVKLIDRTFNCNHRHAVSIWNYIREHDNGVTNFHFEIAADLLSEEEILLLREMRPGLVQLEIGVQSTNLKTLEAIHRKTDLERLKRNTAAIRSGGNIHQHLDLIAGLPYEDYASFANSFCEVYDMRPDQLQLGFLKVLKGSLMYEKAGEFGIIYTRRAPYEVLYSRWLTYEQVLRLKRIEEMVELYYNSGQFTHVLPVLRQAFETPFAMFEALADYYRENGYFTNQPSRAYRYQVLLQFAGANDAEHEALYQELCTFDLYLRENAKSRPGFACDRKEYAALCPRQPNRQTHAEVFRYPVWELHERAVPEKLRQPAVVIFDYENRNPLNKAAAWRVIS